MGGPDPSAPAGRPCTRRPAASLTGTRLSSSDAPADRTPRRPPTPRLRALCVSFSSRIRSSGPAQRPITGRRCMRPFVPTGARVVHNSARAPRPRARGQSLSARAALRAPPSPPAPSARLPSTPIAGRQRPHFGRARSRREVPPLGPRGAGAARTAPDWRRHRSQRDARVSAGRSRLAFLRHGARGHWRRRAHRGLTSGIGRPTGRTRCGAPPAAHRSEGGRKSRWASTKRVSDRDRRRRRGRARDLASTTPTMATAEGRGAAPGARVELDQFHPVSPAPPASGRPSRRSGPPPRRPRSGRLGRGVAAGDADAGSGISAFDRHTTPVGSAKQPPSARSVPPSPAADPAGHPAPASRRRRVVRRVGANRN